MMQGIADLNAYLNDVGVFLDMEEKEDADAQPIKIPGFQVETIEFVNVSFRYPGREEYVLKNCSFVLQGNKCYAVVGKNGAGKSTLTKLLTGLYIDYEGQILINGKDLREYQYGEVKWMFSVVFQDFARYALSFRDNILVGNVNENNEQRLEQILEKLELESCVQELPWGLDSQLGKLEKDGVDLSGGQWQKLAIARLLYSQAPINILDEPTAALDSKAEAKVYEMFRQVNEEKFTILVTHRLGAARMADEILTLDQGRIVEQGTHNALAGLENGLYKEMFDSQRRWYEA